MSGPPPRSVRNLCSLATECADLDAKIERHVCGLFDLSDSEAQLLYDQV